MWFCLCDIVEMSMSGCRGPGGIVGEREVDVAVRQQHEGSCGDENALCLDCFTIHIPVVIMYCCCCCCWVASVVSDSVRPHRPPGSPVPWILQARTLEWVAISFSNAWKWKVKVKLLNRVRLLVTSWTAAYQAPLSMGFSRQEDWNGVPLPSPDNVLKFCKLLPLGDPG